MSLRSVADLCRAFSGCACLNPAHITASSNTGCTRRGIWLRRRFRPCPGRLKEIQSSHVVRNETRENNKRKGSFAVTTSCVYPSGEQRRSSSDNMSLLGDIQDAVGGEENATYLAIGVSLVLVFLTTCKLTCHSQLARTCCQRSATY